MSDKPAEQADHARGAGREADVQMTDEQRQNLNGWNALSTTAHRQNEKLWPTIEAIAFALFRYMPDLERRLERIALEQACGEPSADTGTMPNPDPWIRPCPVIYSVQSAGSQTAYFNRASAERSIAERKEPHKFTLVEYVPKAAAERGTTPPPSTVEFEPLLRGDLKHGRSCPSVGAPMDEGNCDCGLKWRIRLQTEMTLRNAWEKRAYEAEAVLTRLRRIIAGA